jgi:hypothetical protein
MNEKKMYQTIEKLEKEIADLKESKLRNRIQNFFSKSFTKVHWILGIVIVVVASSLIVYATQITFTDGTVISASEVNSNFTELYDKTSNYSVHVYHDTIQTINNNTATTLIFNSEHFDNGDFHSTTTNTDRLTVPDDGIYLINGRVRYPIDLGPIRLGFYLNGTTLIAEQYFPSGESIQVMTIYQLSANDYVSLQTIQNSGSDVWIEGLLKWTEFSMVRLASD